MGKNHNTKSMPHVYYDKRNLNKYNKILLIKMDKKGAKHGKKGIL